MDEATWLTSDDSFLMLGFLKKSGKSSRRKLRLFSCAAARRMWHLLIDPKSCLAVEAAERYADGAAGADELRDVFLAAMPSNLEFVKESWKAQTEADLRYLETRAVGAAWNASTPDDSPAFGMEEAACMVMADVLDNGHYGPSCDLLRESFGNPFQSRPALDPAWLAWNNGAVTRLATVAYEKRALPAGRLDPGLLGILADTLEESGCHDAAILDHLRSPGPHLRGCFGIDWLLGND